MLIEELLSMTERLPEGAKRPIFKFKYPEMENCWLILSFSVMESKYHDLEVKPFVSFFYDAGRVGAEWEPRYGPIQIWRKADSLTDETRTHYFYEFVHRDPLNWSQLAVDREGLKDSIVTSDLRQVFCVLKQWAESRE